jgi:hypothetical protein
MDDGKDHSSLDEGLAWFTEDQCRVAVAQSTASDPSADTASAAGEFSIGAH